MLESGGPGAGAWLNFPREPEHIFTDVEFKCAARLRMSLPIFQEPCSGHNVACDHKNRHRVCGANLDTLGIHALCCKLGGHVVQRHNAIRDTIARVMRNATTSTVHIEQNAPDTPSHLLRPDIVFSDFRSRTKHLDVEVCTMHRCRVSGQHKAGALIETEEGVKRRKYNHLHLIPCVLSHVGRVGRGLQSLLKLIYRQADEGQRSTCIAAAYQSISATLQKGNVQLLAKAGPLV
jgi:hypothetical protein